MTRNRIRDLSEAQYRAAMRKRGFTPLPFMGYWFVPGSDSLSISDWNAPGGTYRSRLAYMLREADRHERRAAQPEGR